jgi:hypothetical protein
LKALEEAGKGVGFGRRQVGEKTCEPFSQRRLR